MRSTDELKETLAAEQREDLSFGNGEAVKELPVKYQEVTSHLFTMGASPPPQIATVLQQKESTVTPT